MNKKEYYVQINKSLWNTLKPLQLGGVGKDLCPDEYGYGQYFIAEYDPEMSYVKLNKDSFTTSELTEFMDGALLKRIPGGVPLDELGKDKSCYVWIEGCNYWKNPLIELVPVEEVNE
ncbi:hypothetical protein ABLU29_00110 (plasmid) [Lactococcus lactis]|uniref:hypothetical protein n=1 Tax=Lactococcus lactis TaxID=1358 RepID=UPI0033136ECA